MTCLLCNHETAPVIVNRVARNGTPQVSVSCARCGFVQADPMPTADELHAYYASGRYRAEFPPLPVAGIDPADARYEAALTERDEAAASDLLHPAIAGIRPGQSAIEIGCGEGRLASVLTRAGVLVDAWDEDPRMRAAAASRGVNVSIPTGGKDWLYALQVLEHMPDPAATLGEWRDLLADHGRIHVQVPTIERMYGGAQHFFQWPHVVNFTTRTLLLSLLRAGFQPTACGINGSVLYATATKAERPLSYEEADALLANSTRDDVPALIAAHEASRPKPTLLDRFVSGGEIDNSNGDGNLDEEALRAEVRRMRDALDLARESIAKLSVDFGKQSIAEGERWTGDAFWWGYQCGKSRQYGVASVVLGALGNSIAAREAGNK